MKLPALLATTLLCLAANLAHADEPASAPFTPEQQLVLEKFKSELSDKTSDVTNKLEQLEARLQSKQEYDKDVLALAQKNVDWMLAFMGLTLAAAAFLGWRTKARIESEWAEQEQQIDKAHQQAVTDTDKAREALTQEVGRSLAEARERLKELREELKHARSMNTEIRQIRDSAVTPRADAPAAEIEAAQKENEANAEHSPQSKLAALAQKFGKEENWEAAASRWQALTDLEPENTDYWFNYGYAINEWIKQSKESTQILLLASKAHAAWQQVITRRPSDAVAHNNWGNALLAWAKTLSGVVQQQRFAEADQRYAEATHLKKDFSGAYNNWGIALSTWAMTLEGEAQQLRFSEADQRYAEATRLQPDYADAYVNWANVLLHWAHTMQGSRKVVLLSKAEEILRRTEDSRGEKTYNLACLRAMQQRPDEARDLLEETRAAGFLPDFEHLNTDKDLDSLRELDWFKQLMEEVRQQEEAQAAQPA